EKMLIEKKYPGLNLFNVQPKDIWKDTLRNEIFITPYSGEMIRYDIDKGLFTKYPLKTVTTFLNSDDSMLVGNMVGLYVIDKNTGNCAPASNVPFGFQIKKLAVLGGKLLINDKTYSLDLNI